MAEADSTQKRTIRDLLRVVFRRKTLFLLGASLAAIGILLAAHLVPLKYTGTTIFERRSDPAAQARGSEARESFESYKLTMKLELAGDNAIRRAIKDLGLDRGMPHGPDGRLTDAGMMAEQQLVQELSKAITVKWDARSEQVDLISVSITLRDPWLAQRLPDTLVTNYINVTSEQIVGRLSDSKKFLGEQVANGKSRLNELLDRKLEFETRYAGMLPDNPAAVYERIMELNADMDVVRRQQVSATQKAARLRGLRQGGTGPTTQPAQVIRGHNPEYLRLKEQLQQSREQLDLALTVSRMTDEHPTVKTLRAKIANMEGRLSETPPVTTQQEVYGTDSNTTDLSMELASAEAEAAMAAGELERLQNRVAPLQTLWANFGPVRQDYLRLVKELEDQQAEIARWQRKLDDVQMSLAAEVAKRGTHLAAVQTAERQFRPSFPTLWMVLAAAVAGSLGIGAGLVFVVNMLDRSVETTEEAASYFGLPIHGVISEIVTPRQRLVRRVRFWTLAPAVFVVILLTLAASALSVVLWLQYPEQYAQWKAAPISFIAEHADRAIGHLRETI